MKADKEQLLRRIMEDDAFADKLETMADDTAALKFIHENGINVTEQDLKEMAEKAANVDWSKVTINGMELPDEMLENVAGGSKADAKLAGKCILYGFTHPCRAIGKMIKGDWDGIQEEAEQATVGDALDSLIGLIV